MPLPGAQPFRFMRRWRRHVMRSMERFDPEFIDYQELRDQEIEAYLSDLSTRSVRASVRRTSNQSINSATVSVILFDTEDYDTDGLFAGNPIYAFFAPRPGTYGITAKITMASIPSGRFFAEISIVSNLTGVTRDLRNSCAGEDTAMVSATVTLTTADSVQIRVFHVNGGGAINCTAAWAEMVLVT